MSLAIVIPVKSPQRAKHRLSGLLSEAERFQLANAMARDVFGTVAELKEYRRFVVSDDPTVLEEARQYGLEPVDDQVRQGQSAAVRQGFKAAWDEGFSAGLTIPGDVPAVSAQEVRQLATHRPEIEVLLVSDRERTGTNGLRLVPPHAISLRFGEDSFTLHRAEAARSNRSFGVLELQGLQCDLDQPADVTAFLRLNRDTETLRLLLELEVPNRILASTPRRG